MYIITEKFKNDCSENYSQKKKTNKFTLQWIFLKGAKPISFDYRSNLPVLVCVCVNCFYARYYWVI